MASPHADSGYLISVIIAHLNQPEYLQICLTSLQKQSFDMARVEVIVVDNGSRDLPAQIISQFAGVRLETEQQAGPGPARNRGVALSTAPILAFIDADCIAAPDWLSTISRTMKPDSGVDIAGGKVMIGVATADHPTLVEAYEQVFSFRQKDYIERQGFSGSGNLTTRREIFERVGPFGGIAIAEDRDWGQRARQMGIKTHYVADMLVTHPARNSMAEILKKMDRVMGHDYAGKEPGLAGNARWVLKAVAVAGSPALSAVHILRSKDLTTWRQRILAGRGLLQVRLYRARKMLSLMFAKNQSRDGPSWNRG
jgi:glycosyltransferase involved in cell wall biosynthesis